MTIFRFDKSQICCKKCKIVIKVQNGGRVNTIDEQSLKDERGGREDKRQSESKRGKQVSDDMAQLIPDRIG